MYFIFLVGEEPVKVLEDLLNLEKNISSASKVSSGTDSVQMTKGTETYASWLLQFPTQCTLVAEAIMWERQVHKALEKQDRLELIAQR